MQGRRGTRAPVWKIWVGGGQGGGGVAQGGAFSVGVGDRGGVIPVGAWDRGRSVPGVG